MSKRTGVWMLCALMVVVAVVVAFFAYNGTSRKFEFTTEQAQTLLNASLEKRALDEKTVNVESATIVFVDDKITIDAAVNGKIKNRLVRADVHAVGKPDYRGESFYFVPTEKPVFSNVKVEKVGTKPQMFERTKNLLKKHVEKYLADHGWEDVVESFRADFQQWALGVAEKGVETALTKRPIYTPKNDLKGFVIKAAVEKVEVVGDKLVVTLSLTQILYTIFIALVMLLIAIGIIVFLFTHPEFGVALALLPNV